MAKLSMLCSLLTVGVWRANLLIHKITIRAKFADRIPRPELCFFEICANMYS